MKFYSKRGKKLACVFLIFILIILCIGCNSHNGNNTISSNEEKEVIIPDISLLDETTAKTIIAQKGLIPRIEYAYDDYAEEGLVIETDPAISTSVKEDTVVIIYISKGPSYYELRDAVGYMCDIDGIDPFKWGTQSEGGTKAFFSVYVEEGFLYIDMMLCCKSRYKIEFYNDGFGRASITDTFDKTVPITVLSDSKTIDNTGKATYFTVKIPLSDLSVKKPTDIYVEVYFVVNGNRQTFESGFNLSW